jgi:hypothetical protein
MAGEFKALPGLVTSLQTELDTQAAMLGERAKKAHGRAVAVIKRHHDQIAGQEAWVSGLEKFADLLEAQDGPTPPQ